MKKFFTILCLMVVSLSLIISCGGGAADDSRSQTLIVAMSSDIVTLDPSAQNDSYSANAMTQIYEGLVHMTPGNEVVPSLAERYEISPDGLEYTFYIKRNVKFHNGEELKAEDVIFSFKRAFVSPAVAHIFSAIDADSLTAVDDYTVKFKMKMNYSGILMALCHTAADIVNKKAVEAAGDDYSKNPIGTGPYKFVSRTNSYNLILERFEDFHGEKPYYKNIEFRIIPEATNRMIELESGGADIVYDISPNDLDRFEGNSEIQLIRSFDYLTQYMGMNCSKAPLDDVRVRKAIACAVDTDQIVKAVWKGLGTTATGPYAPAIPYSISRELQPIKRDVEKAKKLLAEAGYADGLKLRLSTNERQERIDMAVIMKEQLKEVGIELNIEVMEWSKYLELLESGNQELFEIGWSSDTPDPDMVVYPCFHSSSKGPGGNFVFLSDPEVDDLIMQGRAALDGPERAEIYHKIQRRIMDLCPAIFQYNGELAAGIKANLTGLTLSPLGHHYLGNVKPIK